MTGLDWARSDCIQPGGQGLHSGSQDSAARHSRDMDLGPKFEAALTTLVRA